MKILIRGVILAVVVFVALFVGAQVLINRPFVHEKITKILSDRLQREITLSGMSVSFFPSIGINLKGLNVSKKDKKDSFVSLDNLRVNVELFPLFKKRLVVKEIVLDRPKINIEKDANGKYSFSDLLGASVSEEKPAESSSQTSSINALSDKFSFDSIRVNEASFFYKEILPSGEAKSFQMSGLDLWVDHFSFTEPVSLKLVCAFGKGAHLTMIGKVGPLGAPKEQIEAAFEVKLEGVNSTDFAVFGSKEDQQGLGFENLSVKGTLSGNLGKKLEGNLKLSLRLLPSHQEMQLEGALTAMEMKEFILKDFGLHLGSTDLTLTGELKNLESLQGELQITSNQVDMKEILALSGKKEKAVSKERTAPAAGAENLFYGNSAFQNAQIKISADLKNIQYEDNHLWDLLLKINLKEGVLSLDEFSVSAYGGKIDGGGTVNLHETKIDYHFQTKVRGVQLEKVAADNHLGEQKIEGTLTGDSDFKGQGLAQADLQSFLSGHAKVEVKEGKIKGSNLKAEIVSKMDNPLLSQFLPGLAKMREETQREPQKETPFKDFVIDLAVDRGQAALQNANLTTDDLILRASGVVGFDYQANLQAHAVFSKNFTERLTNGKDLSDKLPYENGGLHIPVKITGDIRKPSVMPDLGVIISTLTKGQLSDKVGKLLGGKEGKKGDKGNALSQILGGTEKQSPESGQAQGNQKSIFQKNPLSGFLEGNQNDQQSQDQDEKSSEKSDNNPLNKLKLF